MSKRGTALVNWDVVADLGFGESLIVVGNESALGSGNVENGLSLVTSKEYWPIWRSHKPLQVKLGQKISYRLAVFSGGKFDRWGNSGETFLPTSPEVIVEDEIEASAQTITTSFSDKMSISNLSKKKKRRIRRTSSSRGDRTDSMDTDEDSASSPRVVAFAPLPRQHKSNKTQHVVSETRLQSIKKSAVNENRDDSLSPTSRKRSRGFSSISDEHVNNKKKSSTHLNGKDGVVIVVRVLPLVIRKESNGRWFVKWNDEDLNVASELGYSLSSVKQLSQNNEGDDGCGSPRHLGAVKMRVQWVGMPRISTTSSARMDATISMQDRMELQEILSNFGCVPVWPSQEIMRCHHVFCTEILRPVFHNVYDPYGKLPTRLWKKENHSEIWRAYTTMCNEFAKAIVAIHHEGDMIWIQSFHLLILPSILARKIPTATTGIYFDSPFPSSEIFRTLSMREDLMRGLLNADQICFAQYASARHFQACCRRIMGLSHEINSRTGACQVTLQGRRVVISVSHPGIELERLNKYAESTTSLPRDVQQNDRIRPHADRVLRWINSLEKQQCADIKRQKPMIILSLGLLGDALMGHELRMVAARRLLETMPQYRGQIFFLDIAIQEDVSFQKNSASFDLDESGRLKRLYDLTKKVNDVHQGTYEFIKMPPLPTSFRIFLYNVADVFLSTPVRQGVDLYPFEYSYVRKDSRGALIASEFSTFSHVLHGSMFVNPWKMEDLIRAFTFCFSMSDLERQRRMSHSARFITNTSMSLWVYRMLIDLKRCRKRADKFKFKGYGLGLGFRLIAEAEGFSSLDTKAVTRSWNHTKQRVLFLDFRGTIAPYSLNGRRSDAFESRVIREKRLVLPSVQMRRNLVTLASDPRTHVFILSGLETEFLDEAFADFTGVSFVAEHGFFYRRGVRMRGPSTPTASMTSMESRQQNQWRMLLADFKIDLSWIAIVRNIMEVYQQRTMGSRIEQKTSALVWDVSNADSDFAKIQASNMIVQLKPILRNFAVDILEGKGYVEVRQRGVNKGASAVSLLSNIESRSGQLVDFIMCLGDDSSDETMFTALRSKRGSSNNRVFTCTVGKKPSKGEYYVHDVDDVEMLINMLAQQSAKGKASRSMVDLRRLGTSGRSPVRPSPLAFRKYNFLGTSPGDGTKRKRPPSTGILTPSSSDDTNKKNNNKEMDTGATSSFMMNRIASMPFISRRADGTSIQDTPSTLNDFLEDLDNDDEDDDMMGGLFF